MEDLRSGYNFRGVGAVISAREEGERGGDCGARVGAEEEGDDDGESGEIHGDWAV